MGYYFDLNCHFIYDKLLYNCNTSKGIDTTLFKSFSKVTIQPGEQRWINDDYLWFNVYIFGARITFVGKGTEKIHWLLVLLARLSLWVQGEGNPK